MQFCNHAAKLHEFALPVLIVGKLCKKQVYFENLGV